MRLPSNASRDLVVPSTYDRGVRRLRRRRPAGQPRVPIPPDERWAYAPVVGPAFVRIGPDRTLLDPPWGLFGCTVAHVWPDDRVAGGWARVAWPLDSRCARPIAPLDLHLGHVLEFSAQLGGRWIVRFAVVANVDEHALALVVAESATDATLVARRAVDVWRATELTVIADEWRARIGRTEPPCNPSR